MINTLLKQKLKWFPIPETERYFMSDSFLKELCSLRMNDFPEKPLWTLFYKENYIEFDDTPSNWDIVYRNDLDLI